MAPTKFSTTSAMQQLLQTMLKDKLSLVLCTPSNDQQIVLASTSLPTGKKAFKQFFKVSTPRAKRQNQMHMCIGCHVLSNRTLGCIKFHSPKNHLLAWLKQARVFVESDSLGTKHLVTIRYFTKLDPTITHLANFHEHLINQLMMIHIDIDTTIKLAPSLKNAQLEAMSNGNKYVPILPNFELYKTRLSHGHAPSQTMTEVVGVKGVPKDAKLLGKFFMRLASETSNDPCIGVFLPKGAVHLLGPTTYKQVLKENNFFLHNVVTIPVNMEYGAWFAIIDPDHQSKHEPVSLREHLLHQSWFLYVESAARNNCILVTTRSNLQEACKWIDENLQWLIRKSIPSGIDLPASLLPHRLDKPVYSATSQSYANISKKQFSLATNTNMMAKDNNRPPRKCQATVLDYDLDKSTEYPPLVINNVPSSTGNTSNSTAMQPTTMATPGYAMELLLLQNEISQLKMTITTAMEQIKQAITSLHTNPPTTSANAMDTKVENNMSSKCQHEHNNHHPNQLNLPAIINKLKNDIATITNKMSIMFQQYLPPKLNNNTPSSSVT